MNILIWYIDYSLNEDLINKVHKKSDAEEPCSICLVIFWEK